MFFDNGLEFGLNRSKKVSFKVDDVEKMKK